VVLQDKVLSPVISDIKRKQEGLGEEMECAEHQVQGLKERLEHIDMGDEGHIAENAELQSAQCRLDRLTEVQKENEALLKALVKFRGTFSLRDSIALRPCVTIVDIVVAEKDVCDQQKELKRGSEAVASDASEAGSVKTMKCLLPSA
jgi:hypothetical protein